MVSKITSGYPTDEQGRPYRRRRYAPAIITVVVLMVVGVVVWAIALGGGDTESVPTACNQPTPPTSVEAGAPAPAAPPTLTVVGRDEMLGVAPAPLSTFGVRVLNASDERGAARTVSDDLTAQGFTPVPDNPYADDPVYPNRDLDCVAQIRFGPAGRAAAAATWLAFPCAQLVDDGRRGTAVDVALGIHHSGGEMSQDAQAALEALRSADPKNPASGVDPVLVEAVHSTPC
ncbi:MULTISPECIES: envelope integrity protein Cei [Gordonia]|uniref:envelope integrity protein Cei n=1 Tax=Gordonia TaxID=2053 RepID=UPI0033908BFA